MNHADSLNLLLSNERMRLAFAKTSGERELRAVWVKQLEKELAGETKFQAMTDDEILAALTA